jgi:hypothetical protein
MIEAAKILNNEQRQALIDIFKTLDQAEKSVPQPILLSEKLTQALKICLKVLFIKMNTANRNSIKNIGQVITVNHITGISRRLAETNATTSS